MIALIDYGVGNVQAFLNMFKRLGVEACRASTPEVLQQASHLILPGVGAFDHAMTQLQQSGLRPALEALVLERKMPVLGICVGMQMLASGSDEGQLPGLNWVPGRVKAFAQHPDLQDLPMPHMGWNDVQFRAEHPLFFDFDTASRFYFLHSYYFEAADRADVVATAEYGIDFDCIVSRGSVHGIQCHPEKSHHFGAQFLKNFAEL